MLLKVLKNRVPLYYCSWLQLLFCFKELLHSVIVSWRCFNNYYQPKSSTLGMCYCNHGFFCVIMITNYSLAGHSTTSSLVSRRYPEWNTRNQGSSCYRIGWTDCSDQCRSSQTICGQYHRPTDSYPWWSLHMERESGCPGNTDIASEQGGYGTNPLGQKKREGLNNKALVSCHSYFHKTALIKFRALMIHFEWAIILW